MDSEKFEDGSSRNGSFGSLIFFVNLDGIFPIFFLAQSLGNHASLKDSKTWTPGVQNDIFHGATANVIT